MDRAPPLRKLILADTSLPKGIVWTLVAVAVPTLVRWAIDRGQGGIPFVTYFPAIVLAAVFLGWKYGAATALLSAIVGNRVLNAVPVLFYVRPRDALFFALYAITCAILIYVTELLRRLVRQQDRAAQREAMLNAELVHRVKNLLATVNSLASLSARHSLPEDFVEAFGGRIAALGRATDLLGSSAELSCEFVRLVDTVIEPFRTERNFQLEGPEFSIPRDSCVPLALALHELCTNAVKYGALSAPEGSVSLHWELAGAPDDRALIRWRESGGPPVGQVERRGMGMALLQPQPGLSHVALAFPREGATCEMTLALA